MKGIMKHFVLLITIWITDDKIKIANQSASRAQTTNDIEKTINASILSGVKGLALADTLNCNLSTETSD